MNCFVKEPARILFAIVATTAGASAADAIDTINKKPGSVGWSKRSSPVTAVETNHQPDLSWGGGAYHAHIGIEAMGSDTPSMSLGVLNLSKNAPVAEHVHDKEWEVMAIIEGEGELVKKGSSVKVAPGAIVAVPPGTPHAWKPSGTSALLAVQMYSPPGPEQRFKKLAESAPAAASGSATAK